MLKTDYIKWIMAALAVVGIMTQSYWNKASMDQVLESKKADIEISKDSEFRKSIKQLNDNFANVVMKDEFVRAYDIIQSQLKANRNDIGVNRDDIKKLIATKDE